jgi:hypothetical protein
MTTSDEILLTLSEMAQEFDFPVLDNAHWKLVAGRMRGFRSEEAWGLLFEILVFHIQASEFSVEVYGYGPLVGEKQGFLDSIVAVKEIPEHWLWNEEGEWIISDEMRVAVFGTPIRTISVAGLAKLADSSSPDLVALSFGDNLDEGAFARALVRELGFKQMLPDELVFRVSPRLPRAAEVLRLTNWDHPDIAGGQTPSASQAIVGSARVLAGEVERLTYDSARDNVYWFRWLLPTDNS